eukprot:scpid109656/ scgid20868/ 
MEVHTRALTPPYTHVLYCALQCACELACNCFLIVDPVLASNLSILCTVGMVYTGRSLLVKYAATGCGARQGHMTAGWQYVLQFLHFAADNSAADQADKLTEIPRSGHSSR